MMNPRQPDNTKACPGCGTWLIASARRCSVCGYVFNMEETQFLSQEVNPRTLHRSMRVTLSLPALLLFILVLLAVNTLTILGLQKRDVTKTRVAGEQATSTFMATSFVSPTSTITPTRTPPPPTMTIIPVIEYTVVSGDSCLSIATRYKISFNALVAENKIDCSLLKIGTVLVIPRPTATPVPTSTMFGDQPAATP